MTTEQESQYAELTDSNHQLLNLDPSMKTYLIPMTKGLHNFQTINDSFSEHILRSGFGLQSYVTNKNEEIWIENGIQYRPFPFLEKKENPFYTSEFEAYVPFNQSLFFEGVNKMILPDIKEKKIILWWQHKFDHLPINGLNALRACPDFPCVLTSDRKYTVNSSAMLVNAQYVINQSPPKRRPDQVLIHYQIEAPFKYWYRRSTGNLFNNKTGWNSVFNWTMSYRMDADITTYHGIVRRRRAIKEKNYQEIVSNKTGVIAWMVSMCNVNSRREDYVKELQKYVSVDIYGGCGPFHCPRISDKQCLHNINTKYKFYLGFENNLCKDYITEKLFRFLNTDMIVIARGYNTYSRLLPSEIFLNTANFKSPKELADRILFLHSHDQEYIQMLKEKDKYFAAFEDYPLLNPAYTFLEYRFEAVSMCEVCRRIWNLENYTKVYSDMHAWLFKEEYQCQAPKDLV
ncbi:hypothetical protein Btru_050549 [Bulinus truncatus]|nr:hypothetical protein Btru_050549 [Bulinus truncatus]